MNKMNESVDIFQVFDYFLHSVLGIKGMPELFWEGPGEAVIGEFPEMWCRDPIFARFEYWQENLDGPIIVRRARIEFTRDKEKRGQRTDCPLICTLDGTETVREGISRFKIDLLPYGRDVAMRFGPKGNFMIMCKIGLLFHNVCGQFQLDEKLEPLPT